MRRSSSKLLVCEIMGIVLATAIAAILFAFPVEITTAQEQESEELQQQSPPPSASVDDRITETMQEIIANSTLIYNGSNTSSIQNTINSSTDNSASGDKLTLRWSNVTYVAARTSHVFTTECQPNEIPLSGTWHIGSGQYLSVIANYPSIEGGGETRTENSLSWTVVVFNSHESNSFPAAGGVLCKSSTISANATTIEQLLIEEEEQQQEEQSETSSTEASSLPREIESEGGGLTATLNGDSFTRGDIITVNGTVEEGEPGSFVGIEVIDPQSEIVERGVSAVTAADNNTFTYSFVAGEQEEDQEFDIDEPMVTSGNYRMVLTYFTPGEPLDMEQVELVFEYNDDATTTTAADISDAEEPEGGPAVTTTTNASLTLPTQGEEEDDDDIDDNAGQTASVSGASTTSISIVPGSTDLTEIAYHPNPVQISVGDTITWTNDDSQPHTVTSGEAVTPDGRFDSGIMAPAATFDFTFTEAGEYPYFCLLHPNMVGTVSVG